MGQTAENVAIMTGISRENRTAGACAKARTRPKAIRTGSSNSTPCHFGRHPVHSTDDGPRPGAYERSSELKPNFPADLS